MQLRQYIIYKEDDALFGESNRLIFAFGILNKQNNTDIDEYLYKTINLVTKNSFLCTSEVLMLKYIQI